MFKFFILIYLLQWSCCGLNGPEDFGALNIATLPESCCAPGAALCTIVNAHKGCAHIIGDFIPQAANTLGGVILGLAAVEV